ncbi:MAG TPA: hypothetical protein VFP91_00640 [Vicinamibacterales bacterium]|nr:hypothetical protein [Vicinamibacterales bacterium]
MPALYTDPWIFFMLGRRSASDRPQIWSEPGQISPLQLRSGSVRQRNGYERTRKGSDPQRSSSDREEIDRNRATIGRQRLRSRSDRTEIDAEQLRDATGRAVIDLSDRDVDE